MLCCSNTVGTEVPCLFADPSVLPGDQPQHRSVLEENFFKMVHRNLHNAANKHLTSLMQCRVAAAHMHHTLFPAAAPFMPSCGISYNMCDDEHDVYDDEHDVILCIDSELCWGVSVTTVSSCSRYIFACRKRLYV